MNYFNIENGFEVTVNKSEANEKADTVSYTRVDNGETFFIARKWFNKWFKPVANNTPTRKQTMKRQSTTVKVTNEILSLIADYIELTDNGVMLRYKGREIGVFMESGCLETFDNAFNLKGNATIKKETLAHMVSDLASRGFTEWQDRIFYRNTGTGKLPGLLFSIRNHGYTPTISGSHWHHHAMMLAITQEGETYFRDGMMVHAWCESVSTK